MKTFILTFLTLCFSYIVTYSQAIKVPKMDQANIYGKKYFVPITIYYKKDKSLQFEVGTTQVNSIDSIETALLNIFKKKKSSNDLRHPKIKIIADKKTKIKDIEHLEVELKRLGLRPVFYVVESDHDKSKKGKNNYGFYNLLRPSNEKIALQYCKINNISLKPFRAIALEVYNEGFRKNTTSTEIPPPPPPPSQKYWYTFDSTLLEEYPNHSITNIFLNEKKEIFVNDKLIKKADFKDFLLKTFRVQNQLLYLEKMKK